jgi:hypothetical protein
MGEKNVGMISYALKKLGDRRHGLNVKKSGHTELDHKSESWEKHRKGKTEIESDQEEGKEGE